jgi:hypothetical protein
VQVCMALLIEALEISRNPGKKMKGIVDNEW